MCYSRRQGWETKAQSATVSHPCLRESHTITKGIVYTWETKWRYTELYTGMTDPVSQYYPVLFIETDFIRTRSLPWSMVIELILELGHGIMLGQALQVELKIWTRIKVEGFIFNNDIRNNATTCNIVAGLVILILFGFILFNILEVEHCVLPLYFLYIYINIHILK